MDWVEFNSPDLPGKSLVTINFSGYVSILNLETKKTVKTPVLAQGTANVINKIETGPEGSLYMSGIQTGKGAIYDPEAQTKIAFNMGQGDSMAAFGNKIYLAYTLMAILENMILYSNLQLQTPRNCLRLVKDKTASAILQRGTAKLLLEASHFTASLAEA
ncbi:hypothetical protein [Bacillus sp. V2I10]|uniref:hypothetical protein n=1 Tax=Bacillus sp. V2I10 TaxID=3042276 RepID=UPI0027827F43|nr:hypothetical protein [Bacillus sp. V2I10]MDQ0857388.1 WD40 repeat protein [Bacillus sp. V2I10]